MKSKLKYLLITTKINYFKFVLALKNHIFLTINHKDFSYLYKFFIHCIKYIFRTKYASIFLYTESDENYIDIKNKIFNINSYAASKYNGVQVNNEIPFTLDCPILILCTSKTQINKAIKMRCYNPNALLFTNIHSLSNINKDEIETYVDFVFVETKYSKLTDHELTHMGISGALNLNILDKIAEIFVFFQQLRFQKSYTLLEIFSIRSLKCKFETSSFNRIKISFDYEFNKSEIKSFEKMISLLKIEDLRLSEDLYWLNNLYSHKKLSQKELQLFLLILLKKGAYLA